MKDEMYPYIVVVLDTEGEEVASIQEMGTPATTEETGASVAFSSFEKAQQFYDKCKKTVSGMLR